MGAHDSEPYLADGTIETRKALGVECAVGRWVHLDGHVAPRHTIALSDSYVLAPDYPGPSPKPLVNAAREVALVLGTVGGDRVAPVDVPTIDARFGASGRSLVHLVCHGADSPETGIQSIYLEGGDDELQSIEVGQIAGVVAALKKRPMVFLNACEVGRPAISLSGIGGFAQAFIKFGASSVIAPLWSVRDSIAFDVAERFYGAVKASRGSGRSYADILREIRALAYADDGGEDTYAAYCFYGDPTAVV